VEAIRIDRVRPSPVSRKADQDILVDGAGLDAVGLLATLDGQPLTIVSQASELLVARLKADVIGTGGYRLRTPPCCRSSRSPIGRR
jgi:hypothetical protein